MSAVTKPFKSKPFYKLQGKPEYHTNPYMDQLINYFQLLTDTKSKFRFFIKSGSEVAPCLKPRTVLHALKKGHHNIEIWRYNHEIVNTYYDKDSRSTVFIKTDAYTSFTLDIDKDIFNNPKSSYDVEKYIQNVLKCPVKPAIIAITSPGRYHIVFQKRSSWTWDEKRSIICMLLKINTIPESDEDFRKICEDNGVDWVYLQSHRRSVSREKFRIPGSWHVKNGKYNIVTGHNVKDFDIDQQIPVLPKSGHVNNKDHKWLSNEKPLCSVRQLSHEEVQEKVRRKQKSIEIVQKNKDKYYTHVHKLISDNIKTRNNDVVNIFTDLIIRNVSRLLRGDLVISQLQLAEVTGIPQKNVSRYLKSLIESDVIKITEDYIFNPKDPKSRKARVYAFGDFLLNNINFTEEDSHNIYEEYKDGITSEQLLNDIRFLYISGYKNEDIADFCDYKQKLTRPNVHFSKLRGLNEIKQAVDLFQKKMYPCIKKRQFRPSINVLYNNLRNKYVYKP